MLAAALILILPSCGKGDTQSTAAPIVSPNGITVNLPDVKVMYTENFTVTDKMASFQFYSMYESFKKQLDDAGVNPVDLGLLTSVSLKEQKCSIDSGSDTWFDYFLDQAEYSLMEQLVLSEAATAEGVSLDDEDLAKVDSAYSAIKKGASSAGVAEADYIRAVYGKNVTAGDIKSSLKLMYLAEKYLNHCIDEADVSDDALEAIYNEKRDVFDTVSYLAYTFDADKAGFAEELAKCTGKEDFLSYVENFMLTELGLGVKDFEKLTENGMIYEDAYVSGDSPYAAWAADASIGDVEIKTEESGKATVLLLTKERGPDERLNEDGVETWKADAADIIREKVCEDAIKAAAKAYPVTIDRAELEKIEG